MATSACARAASPSSAWAVGLMGRRGSGPQRLRRVDLDRLRPGRRVQHQPPDPGAGQHRRPSQDRGPAPAHCRHPSRLPRPPYRRIRRADNWPALLTGAGLDGQIDGLIDACDQMRAKPRWPTGHGIANCPLSAWALQAVSGSRRPWKSPTSPRSRTTRCSPRCANACANTQAPRANGRIGTPCVFSARGRAAPRRPTALRGGWQPELCQATAQRQRHRCVRALRRRRTNASSWPAAPAQPETLPAVYNRGLSLAQLASWPQMASDTRKGRKGNGNAPFRVVSSVGRAADF